MSVFCCPVCSEPLNDIGKSYICTNRHSFDKAKSGYVHLLTHASGAKGHGDNKAMVCARRDFLETGAYDELRAAIVRMAEKYTPNGGTLLDSGCGEGYYTEAICAHLGARAAVLGFDISKDAVNLAAKRCKAARFAVASAFRIPMADKSVDVLTEIFSPFSEAEFARVLKKNGILIEVIPGTQHLYGLKAAVYDTPYQNEVNDFMRTGYALEETVHLTSELHLRLAQDIQNLFLMTPYYYKTGRAEQARLAALESLTTETEFYVLVYRKK